MLDGYSGATVKAALANLPADRAPNASQFAELCRAHAVGHSAPALPAPELTDEERRQRADVGRMVSQAIKMPLSGARERAIQRLTERIAQGGATQFQRDALVTMRRAIGGDGMPVTAGVLISADVLPPGMRGN